MKAVSLWGCGLLDEAGPSGSRGRVKQMQMAQPLWGLVQGAVLVSIGVGVYFKFYLFCVWLCMCVGGCVCVPRCECGCQSLLLHSWNFQGPVLSCHYIDPGHQTQDIEASTFTC